MTSILPLWQRLWASKKYQFMQQPSGLQGQTHFLVIRTVVYFLNLNLLVKNLNLSSLCFSCVWKRDLNLRDIRFLLKVATQLDGFWQWTIGKGILINLKERQHKRKAMREYNSIKLGEMKTDLEQKSTPAVLWSNMNDSECWTFQPDCFPEWWVP